MSSREEFEDWCKGQNWHVRDDGDYGPALKHKWKVWQAARTLPADAVVIALFAFMKERSAQMGEPFHPDAWEDYKTLMPDEYNDKFHQMQAAITALGFEVKDV